MRYHGHEIDDDEYQEFKWRERKEKRRERELLAHPDCRDPDHPGCKYCREEDEDD